MIIIIIIIILSESIISPGCKFYLYQPTIILASNDPVITVINFVYITNLPANASFWVQQNENATMETKENEIALGTLYDIIVTALNQFHPLTTFTIKFNPTIAKD